MDADADDTTGINKKEGIVQLHEENQSLLLLKQFDWENAVIFSFKNQTRLIISYLHINEQILFLEIFFQTLD